MIQLVKRGNSKMSPRHAYDLEAEWVDPYDAHEEKRDDERFKVSFKVNITVKDEHLKGTLVGPGVVRDISLASVYVLTKHQLTVGLTVRLAVPTNVCPPSMGLPKAFLGPGEIVRVTPLDERRNLVAIRFGDAFTENMEFAVFMDHLRSLSTVMTPPPM